MKICSFMTLAALASMALAGCGNSDISKVKAMKFDANPTYTIDQAFGHRKVCESVKWDTLVDERSRNLVEYRCTFKGVVSTPGTNPIAKIAEVFQWSVDANDTPTLAYVGWELTRQNGDVKDAPANGDAVMQVILRDTVTTFPEYDQQYTLALHGL
jgi:hypothetical protein